MKFIINKKTTSRVPSTELYDLGIVNVDIDTLLNESIIYIDQNTIPILVMDGINYLINNFNPNNYLEDYEILLTESDLINVGSGSTVGFIPLTGTEIGNPVTGDIEILPYNGTGKIIASDGTIQSYIKVDYDLDGGGGGLVYIKDGLETVFMWGQDRIRVQSDFSNFIGLSGSSDYSDNITDLDYVQKIYVDDNFTKIVPKLTYVNQLSDLPTPISEVITLLDNITYFIANDIDLAGNRLVGGVNTVLIGGSSENSTLTSTGLGVGVPLLSSIYTTPIRHIAFKDIDTAVSFDGTTNPSDMALDWTGVNFVNVPNIGTVKKATNFIFDKGAFLSSKGLKFDGTNGTIGFGNCLFNGDGLIGSILEILPTCALTRRFRIIYSSVVSFGSTIGIKVSTSATIPNEGYILDTVNFSGGGTYLSGVIDNGDNKTLFDKCRGIVNTDPNSQYYMNGNLTTTPIVIIGTPVKVLGTTSSSSTTQKFANTNNRATYVGATSQIFKIVATLSVQSGNNNQIGCYIAKNGVILPESEVYGTTNGAGRAENIVVQTKTNLSANDYIEIFTENETSLSSILVTDLNVITD